MSIFMEHFPTFFHLHSDEGPPEVADSFVSSTCSILVPFFIFTNKVSFGILIILKPGPSHLLFHISFTLGYYVGRFFKQSGE